MAPHTILRWTVVAVAVVVIAVCIVDGLQVPGTPRSNLRFHEAAMHVVAITRGDVLDAAGVLPGDAILAVDGAPLENGLDFADRFARIEPGDTVRFSILRDGELLELETRARPNLTPTRLAVALPPILIVLAVGFGVGLARPRSLPGLLFLLFCATTAINSACQLPLITGTRLPQRVITFAYTMLSLHSPALLLHLFVVFPERRRMQRRLSWWLPAAYLVQIALGLAYYLPTVAPSTASILRDPAVHGSLFSAFRGNVVVCFALAVVSLAVLARRGSTDRTRQQARILFFGIAALVVLQVLLFEAPVWLTGRSLLPASALTWLDLIVPAAVAVAILRHRLFGIDLLVRRSLIYGTTSAFVAAVFVAVAGGVGWAAGRLWSDPDTAVVAAAAAIAAMAFPIVQRRSRDWVDRVLYHRRFSHRRLLAELAEQLAAPLPAGALAALLRIRILECLEPEEVTVAVRRGRGPAMDEAAEDGSLHPLWETDEAKPLVARLLSRPRAHEPSDSELAGGSEAEVVVPVVRGDELLAVAVLGRRRHEVPYVAEDLELLDGMARLAGPVLESALLLEERALNLRLATVGTATAAIAHELKNPLAAITTTSAILRRRLDDDPRGRDLTEVIEEEAARLQRSVMEVLTFVRPMPSDREVFALDEMVRQLAMVVSADLRRSGVELEVQADDGLPPVRGDGERLRQAILNLLVNARDATAGGGRIDVRLEPWTDGDQARRGVIVTVADDGRGFSDEALERAFEPFWTGTRLGTGLGLANVYRTVREHAGEVELANRAQGGAVVTLRIPCEGDSPRDRPQ